MLVFKLFSEIPRLVTLTLPPFKRLLVLDGILKELRTELTLTSIISLWSNFDLPYAKVLTPTTVASVISELMSLTP